jgi:flavin reductase ActVB
MSKRANARASAIGTALVEPTVRTAFKSALADFPAGVVLVTTSDATGAWKGFTASSFCGVSLEPAIVSACIYETAECYEAFLNTSRFSVSFLRTDHQDVAMRFATKGGDKFGSARFHVDDFGMPYLVDSPWVMSCRLLSSSTVGDHEVLFGAVEDIRDGLNAEPSSDPLVYWQRRFSRIAS